MDLKFLMSIFDIWPIHLNTNGLVAQIENIQRGAIGAPTLRRRHPMCGGLGVDSLAGKQLRILIVEDEALVAEDLANTIEAAGALVIGVVAEKRDGVRFAIDHRPDLVLMDIRLRNGDDGIETAEMIRAMTDIPIIFCTGNGDPDTRRRVQAFGNAELLIKPVDYEYLIQLIRRIPER